MASPPDSPSHLNMAYTHDESQEPSTFVRALYDYVSQDDSSLTFQQGDIIEVLTKLPSGWWDGLLGDARGWFPSNYVDDVSPDDVYAAEQEQDGIHALGDEHDDDSQRQDFWQQQQHHLITQSSGLESALSLSASTYPTDGNFSAPLQLSHDYDHLLAGGASQTDVFKQLAEEGMQATSVLTSHPDDEARNATIDLGRPAPTSTTTSTLRPSEREVQRLAQQQRPRAATATLAPQYDPTKLPLRERAASTGTSHDNNHVSKESDYWVPRYHDRDGIVYYNTRTGAQSKDIPDGLDLDYALSPQPSEEDDGQEDDGNGTQLARYLPIQQPATTNYFEKLRQDGTKPGLLPLKPTANTRHAAVHLPDEVRPASMAREEQETYDLQKMLAPSVGPTLGQLLHTALERLSQLIDICAETLDPQGFSDQDRKAAATTPALLDKSGLRLRKTSNSVVQAVRDLLYCVGSLNINAADLNTVSELAWLVTSSPDDGGGSTAKPPGIAAAFGGAVAAAQARSTDVAAKGTTASLSMPTSLRSTGARISSLLSKLVLSARAITEQPIFIGRDRDSKSGTTDGDAERSHADKLTSYRHRIREDAIELVNVLDVFARELEKQKATKSNPSWSRRLEGTFRSANGTAGVTQYPLSGGAAAGWRGAGFVLPSPYETAALRFESQGHFADPSELSKDARGLLAGGKDNLKRRPGQLLSESFLVNCVRPQLENLTTLLEQLEITVRGHSASSSKSAADPEAPTPSSASSASSSSFVGPLSALQGVTAQHVIDQIRAVLVRFGTFIALLEDVDFASVLDVDLPPWSADHGSADSQAASLIYSAKEGLHRFSSLKQACYDVGSQILLESQDISAVLAGHPPDVQISERLLEHSGALKAMSASVVEVSADIAQIAEEQSRAQLPSIGARSKVYDLEDAMVETSHLFAPRSASQQQQRAHRGSDASTTGSAYLAPSLTTPSSAHAPHSGHHPSMGLRTTSLRSASSSAVSPTSTTVGSTRGGWPSGGPNAGIAVAARNRSMSVATGGSGNSGASDQRLRSATDAQQHEHSTESETDSIKAPQRAGSKLRKFFGDDSVASLPQPPLSATSQTPSAPDSATVASSAASTAVSGKRQEETPWFLQPDYDEKEMVVSPEGQVKGATLAALMERLTMHNTFDASFNNTLLMTYRSFTTTSELLELLFARFRITAPSGLSFEELEMWQKQKQQPIRLRVFSVLKSWLESFFYEGEDEEHLDKIRGFAVEIQSHSMELPSRQLLRLVERRQGDGEQMIRKMVLPQSAPPPILPKSRRIKFLDIDPTEMARQLTLLESKLYNKIKPMECLGKAWSKPESDIHAKGIKDTISTSNRITGWVAEAILVQDDLKKRAAWIKQFISIADACRSLNNFSTMTAIVSGLNSAPVYRLKRSWDAVNQRYVMILENLNKIMQSSKNFSDYREMIHKLNPPCVPFLGVYLTDLTFIEDGNPDRLRADERLINFGKRQKTAEVIREIMIYQSTPYNLTPVAGIQKFIEDNLVEARSDSELYQQSLALEPREREDEKISRLLAESGFL